MANEEKTIPGYVRRRMNYAEAVRKVGELWGTTGWAEIRHAAPLEVRYIVGTIGALPDQVAIGKGASWEEAFMEAGHPVRHAEFLEVQP